MHSFDNRQPRVGTSLAKCFAVCALLSGCLIPFAYATEGGASVYPTGVETILPGRMPAPGGTMLLEFNNLYVANGLADAHGHALVPGFHLRVAAVAVKVVHNWGVHLLGGMLVSSAALPYVYQHLNAPFGSGSKSGFGNPDLEPVAVAYHKGPWHWWYGVDAYTPGFSYDENALLNIGQHNFAVAPLGAFSYLPDKGRAEISSRFQYIVNYANPVTHYQSGHEFTWEYAAMHQIKGGPVSVGVNGYYYQQTTDDRQNGLTVGDGNRGRDFAVGPEVRCHLKHYALIAKYEKDTLVQNKARGNAFWLQLGIPLSRGHD